ncbi:MAG: GDP-mannose 4,6-dehydratase [Promethearchaeota archaeon]
MLKNKIILITGAAGFIGSHLTEILLKNNNMLILIDNYNKYYEGKEQQLKNILKNYEDRTDYLLIKGDLIDKKIFNQIEFEIDIVFHLAAQAGVRYSIEHPEEVTNNNIMSTINTFEYALKKQVTKVVYASSSSVYGNPIYTPCDENHPKSPISPYAVSKLCGELYADYYYRQNRLQVTSLRFYTVYGPRGRPDMAIRKFFNLMIKDKEITIYGDGEQLRDFTYISDIVDGLILAAESNKSPGEVFNLGYSNPISVNNLVDKMYEISEKDRKIKYIEKQQGDVDITHSNIEKAKQILNYSPKIHIDDGLIEQYNWQKSNFNQS